MRLLIAILLISVLLAASASENAYHQFSGVKSVADIGRFHWVDPECRVWGSDGDIDIDQTCLVVHQAHGGLVAIPNIYNDAWGTEISAQLKNPRARDKWVARFFELKVQAKR